MGDMARLFFLRTQIYVGPAARAYCLDYLTFYESYALFLVHGEKHQDYEKRKKLP